MMARDYWRTAAVLCLLLMSCRPPNECHCQPDYAVQVDNHWERYESSFSGIVTVSEATELVGYQFYSNYQRSFALSTTESEGNKELVVELVQLGGFSWMMYHFDTRYLPVDPSDIYLDDSGAEQVFEGPQGDRLTLWVKEMDAKKNLLRVDGLLTSVTLTEVVELTINDFAWDMNECYYCYYPND